MVETNESEESDSSESEVLYSPRNITYNFSSIVNAATSFANNPTSKSAFNNMFSKLKALEKEWYEFGVRYEQIQRQNVNLIEKCDVERSKSKIYQKRLKFIKENQDNLERLKQVYINMKKLESNVSMEKHCQTESDADTVIVRRDELDCAKETLGILRQLVEKRENRIEKNAIEISALNSSMSNLEERNRLLTELLQAKILRTESGKMEIRNTNNKSCNTDKVKLSVTPSRLSLMSNSSLERTRVSVLDQRRKYLTTAKRLHPKELKSRDSFPVKLDRSKKNFFGESQRKMAHRSPKGDCKEVAAMKKIRKELEVRQASIKYKIDMFNNMFASSQQKRRPMMNVNSM